MSSENYIENESLYPNFDESAEFGVGRMEFSYGPANKDLLKKMLPVRARFVEAMNWKRTDGAHQLDAGVLDQLPWLAELSESDRQDADIYDTFDDTMHFALLDYKTDEVIVGLRLTKVPSIEASKSWAMIGDRLANEALGHKDAHGEGTIAQLNESASRGNLYDLTRLVCPLDGSISNKEIVAGVMELFAIGYGNIRKNTVDEHQSDVRWICAATELVKLMAENLCLDFASAASGKASDEDDSNTHFCVVKVEETVSNIAHRSKEPRFQFPSEHMFNGFRKAGL